MPVLLLACFVISGASSLVLEVVWSRQLAHVFGSSSLAISTVLATFMGGLALGSLLGGRLADRLKNRGLAAYAVCEVGIALTALSIPLVLEGYPAANAWLWRSFHDQQWLLALLRFLLCAVLLLPPTTLMGATLPLLSRHVIQQPHELRQIGLRVGALYAANTLGAVVGAGGAGFYLLPIFGQRTTYAIAIAADLALAAAIGLALWWRSRHPVGEDSLDAQAPLTPGVELPEPLSLDARSRRAVLWAVGLSGGIAMALEVLWSRALALVIGSSVYSFTLVLVVFLCGLSAGATWIGRPAARARRPLRALALAYLGVGASVVLTHQLIDELPRLFIELIEGTRLSVTTIMGLQALCAALAVAPTAACLGAVMPLTMRAYAGSVDAVGRDVGRAYAANTVGAIIGSFAGGFVILPLCGLELGVRGLGLLVLALSAAMMVAAAQPGRTARLLFAGAAVLAAVMLLAPRWNVGVMTSGVFRITVAKRFARQGEIPKANVVYYADGVSTTVSVERYGDRFALKNNGKVEASSVGDMPTQVLVGLLPVLVHGKPGQKVAVVGYGSGITVGAIAESPLVERVDVVELEPLVMEAADAWFGPFNHEAHENPKVRRFVGDGRNFLTAHPEKYDVIVSEPSNPWIAGVASLFSREFYAFAKQHLAEGGVYCQWAQLYELGPRHVKSIYKTFNEAFPHVYAFSSADLSADTILIGTLEPRALDVAALEALVAEPATRAELARGGVESVEELIALLVIAPAEIASFAAGARVNTDDNGLLEFGAPRDLLAAGRTSKRFADGIYAWGWPYGHLDGTLAGMGEGAARAARELRLARALIFKGKRREAKAWIDRAAASGAPAPEVRAVTLLWRLARERNWDDPEVPLDAGGAKLPPPSADWFDPELPLGERQAAAARLAQLDNMLAKGQTAEAAELIATLPPRGPGPGGDDLVLVRAVTLYRLLDFVSAKILLAEIVKDDAAIARRPALLYYYGRVIYGDGAFEEGAELFERFAARWPELVPE